MIKSSIQFLKKNKNILALSILTLFLVFWSVCFFAFKQLESNVHLKWPNEISLNNNSEFFLTSDLHLDLSNMISSKEVHLFSGNTIEKDRNNKEQSTLFIRLKMPSIYLPLIKQNVGVVYLDNVFIDHVSIMCPIKTSPTGDSSYENLHVFKDYMYNYVMLPSNFDESQYLYIKLDKAALDFKVMLAPYDQFAADQNRMVLYFAVNIGILSAMFISNIILFSASRERQYILHSLYLYCLIQYFSMISGIYKLLFNASLMILTGMWSYMTFFTLTLFIYSILGISDRNKWVNPQLKIIMVISVLGGLLTLIWPESTLLLFSSRYLGVFLTVYLLSISFYYHFRFKSLSNYYMAALAIFGLGSMVLLLTRLNYIETNKYIANFVFLTASFEALLFTVGIADKLKAEQSKNEELISISTTDCLTRLKNRHYFDIIYPTLESEADRYQQALSLILFDLDHFKTVNDQYGHDGGDLVLKRTAEIVKNTLRKPDIAIRWGGEEFIVLLPQTELSGAAALAEKLRQVLEKETFNGLCHVTGSFGIAERLSNESFESLFIRVDLALYKAKHKGRNRLVVYWNHDASVGAHLQLPLLWHVNFNCGHPLMDDQHHTLLKKINILLETYQYTNSNLEALPELDDLINYTQQHFKDEEHLMENMSYSRSKEHQEIHETLVKEAHAFRERFTKEFVTFQELYHFVNDEIVMGHLLTEDFRYYEHIKGHLSEH